MFSKDKIKTVLIVAGICAAAGIGVYKVYTTRANSDNMHKISLNVNNSDIKSNESSSEKKSNISSEKPADETGSSNDSNNSEKVNSDTKKTVFTAAVASAKKAENAKKDQSSESLKNAYLANLTQIEMLDTQCDLENAKTTTDMRVIQGKRYKLWDDELNAIYSELKKTLPKEKMSALQKEESAWIKQKEAKAEKAAQKFKCGTMESVERTGALVSATKERCYYLVNNYM